MPLTAKPLIINRQVFNAVEKAAAPLAPESSEARQVSNRTTTGQPLIRFNHSGYVAFLIAILFLFYVKGIFLCLYRRVTVCLLRKCLY